MCSRLRSQGQGTIYKVQHPATEIFNNSALTSLNVTKITADINGLLMVLQTQLVLNLVCVCVVLNNLPTPVLQTVVSPQKTDVLLVEQQQVCAAGTEK